MDRDALISLVEFYLPVLVTAGDYARQIQADIEVHTAKAGANAWTQALTDADLMVQHYVEISTLARDPTLAFFGEEHQQSANTKYFPDRASTTVHLDPINATYLYQHQRDGWDIILSIREADRLVAAISYMPVRERFYLAVDGCGALTGDRHALSLTSMQPLQTRPGSGLCLTYRAPEVHAKAAGAFECFDIVTDDDPDRGVDNLNDLFTGKLDAFACEAGRTARLGCCGLYRQRGRWCRQPPGRFSV